MRLSMAENQTHLHSARTGITNGTLRTCWTLCGKTEYAFIRQSGKKKKKDIWCPRKKKPKICFTLLSIEPKRNKAKFD